MDLLERLRGTSLFAGLDDAGLAIVAGLAREHAVRAGGQLSRQADLGTTWFLVDSGEAVVQRVDDRGYTRPVTTLRAGDSYGVTALFASRPRDATVIARTPMRVWTIDQGVFLEMLEAHPEVLRHLTVPEPLLAQERLPWFNWLAPGEQVALFRHRHWASLAIRIAAATGITVVVAVLLSAVLAPRGDNGLSPWLIVPGVVYLAYVAWHWIDWLNDQFVVTSQRISYRQQVALFYETRNEVPIDRVQNINVSTTWLAKMLHYGTLIIETAADSGSLSVERVPDPEGARDVIWEQAGRAQATRRAAQRRMMADALASELGIDTREGLATEAGHGPDTPEPQPPPPAPRTGWGRVWAWFAARDAQPADVPVPDDRAVWRKHPIFVLRALFLPIVGVAAAAALLWVVYGTGLLGDPGRWALLSALPLVAALVWTLWVIADWANDLYIITDDRIVDVEQEPFSLRSERREASLDVIQNVRFVIPSFWAAILGYGDVVVQTAGRGDFTFTRVRRPASVQAEVFRRIEAYRERGRQAEAATRRGEMAEWFSVYRDLQAGAGPLEGASDPGAGPAQATLPPNPPAVMS